MKKINAILSNSTKEQYPVLINKLSDIIEPFALRAVGLPPVYVGLEVEQLTVKQSGEGVYVFGINGKDVKSVTNTLTALHNCKEEKIIFCGCDAISGLLMHYLLDELFGRGEYKILHHYVLRLQKEWEWTIDEPIPDKDIIKEWFFCEPERIITTCWDYERTLKAVYDARITNVCIYKFCEYKYITDLPF